MVSVIESFCKREKVQRKEVDDGIVKFSELDNILLGLDAAEFLEGFKERMAKRRAEIERLEARRVQIVTR